MLIKRYLYGLLLVISSLAYSQSESRLNSLPAIRADSLIHSALKLNHYDRQTEIDEIQNIYKLSIWHFAPGVSYDFIRNRCYVTINTAGLANYYVSKKQERRRVGAIERKYKAKDIYDELRISNMIMSIQSDYQDLLLSKKAVQNDVDIFLIHKEQYEQNEIDTEKFLTSKKSIITSIKNHNSAVTALYKDILNLSSVCNSPISTDLNQLYFTTDFID